MAFPGFIDFEDTVEEAFKQYFYATLSEIKDAISKWAKEVTYNEGAYKATFKTPLPEPDGEALHVFYTASKDYMFVHTTPFTITKINQEYMVFTPRVELFNNRRFCDYLPVKNFNEWKIYDFLPIKTTLDYQKGYQLVDKLSNTIKKTIFLQQITNAGLHFIQHGVNTRYLS